MGVTNTVWLLLVLLVILQSELDVLGERIGTEGGAADAIDLGLLGLGHCEPLKLLEHSLGTGEELGSLSVGQSLYLDHLVFLDVYQHGSGALEATMVVLPLWVMISSAGRALMSSATTTAAITEASIR